MALRSGEPRGGDGDFLKNVPTVNRQAAETAYRVLLDPKDGFTRRARIDMEGVRTVLAIAVEMGRRRRSSSSRPGAYYDGSFYEQAVR